MCKTITINNEIAYQCKRNSNYYITKTGILYSSYIKGAHGKSDVNCVRKVAYGTDKDGYFRVVLCNNGKKDYVNIHKLVAEQFIGKVIPPLVINHKDGNKQNNNVENLEIVSIKENTRHAFDIGLIDKYKRNDWINVDVIHNNKTYHFPSLQSCRSYFSDLSENYLRHILKNEVNFNLVKFEKIETKYSYYLNAYYNGQFFKKFKNNEDAANYFHKAKNSISASYKTKYRYIVNEYIVIFPNVSTIKSVTN